MFIRHQNVFISQSFPHYEEGLELFEKNENTFGPFFFKIIFFHYCLAHVHANFELD